MEAALPHADLVPYISLWSTAMSDFVLPYEYRDLSIDQQLALRTCAVNLGRQFGDIYGRDTIERFLHSSYDQFAALSTVPHFLPLLAERFARQRLEALARVEGHRSDGKPVVLFLCTHNAGRSQMALGFFTHLAGDGAVAWSGGTEPGREINAAAVAAMTERGIDITGEYPKPWTDEIVRAADVVVTMGCGDACPIYPGTRYMNWDLDDPAGLDLAAVRPIRDEVERRVRALLDELHVPAGKA
jgi:protein-tyrosine-phosphatase